MTNGSSRSSEFSVINPFCYAQRVVELNPQISDGAINFCLAKQKLNNTQVACLAINFRHLCSAHRMGAVAGGCPGWGRNPTLRVFPVPFHDIPDGIFADGQIARDPAITSAFVNHF